MAFLGYMVRIRYIVRRILPFIKPLCSVVKVPFPIDFSYSITKIPYRSVRVKYSVPIQILELFRPRSFGTL